MKLEMGVLLRGLRLRAGFVNLGKGLEEGLLWNGLRRDAAATFEKAECVDAVESHSGEFFAECGDGGTGELVGGLFGNAEGCADLGIGFAVADAFGDFAEAG
jgi:hypothetical protein